MSAAGDGRGSSGKDIAPTSSSARPEFPHGTEADPFYIPAWLQRDSGAQQVAKLSRKRPRLKLRRRKLQKRPGQTAELRRLGWRPVDIKRMSRREVDELTAIGKPKDPNR